MVQLSVLWLKRLYLEKEALQGLMEEEGEPSQWRQAPVVLSPVLFHRLLLFSSPSLFLFLPWAFCRLQPGPFLTPRGRKQHTPPPPTHGHDDSKQKRRLNRRHNWKEPIRDLLNISYQHCRDWPIPWSADPRKKFTDMSNPSRSIWKFVVLCTQSKNGLRFCMLYLKFIRFYFNILKYPDFK